MKSEAVLKFIKSDYATLRAISEAPPRHWDELSDEVKDIAIGMWWMGMHKAAEIVDNWGDPELGDKINDTANPDD